MENNELIEAVTELLETADDGVLRIGELHEELQSKFGYKYTTATLRKHLRNCVDSREDDSEFTEEASGYWALRGVDFVKWHSKNSNSRHIPVHTRTKLWAKAAGVCQFDGCDKDLTQDLVANSTGNFGQVAHIVAASPDGPRGDQTRSTALVNDYSNLMLMCYPHHRVIDTQDDEYPETLLKKMKLEHEAKTEQLRLLSSSTATQIITIRGVTGKQHSLFEESEMASAVQPRFPTPYPLSIDLTDALPNERDETFWLTGIQIIRRDLAAEIHPRQQQNTSHLSIFAIAPIPFLILIGRIIGDKRPVNLFQFDRDGTFGERWTWQKHDGTPTDDLEVRYPKNPDPEANIVVAISISADVEKTQISQLVDAPIALYEIAVPQPNRRWLRSPSQLQFFRQKYIELIDHIECVHGKNPRIALFPIVPAPIAIDIGRFLLPKAAPTLDIFDRVDKKILPTISIPGEPEKTSIFRTKSVNHQTAEES